MKRRQFFSRLAKAAVAVVATPTEIKFLPARKNLVAAIVAPTKVVPLRDQPVDFYAWLDANYRILKQRDAKREKAACDHFAHQFFFGREISQLRA